MSLYIIMLVAAIAGYVVFMIAVPKAKPEDTSANVKNALERLYEENRANENAQENMLANQLKEESPLVRAVFGLPFMRPIHEAGIEAGFQNDLQQLVWVLFIATLVFAALFVGFGLGSLVVLSPFFGYFMCYRKCKKALAKKKRKFLDQFPDALDMIVRSVRSGFPLTAALKMISENAEEPVREEFRKVIDDIALGRTLTQSLARLAQRIPESDVRFFGIVLAVQQETGGNLSEVIGNLSNVLRKRKQLRGKIRAMTSEGKATGYVLGALPVFIFGALKVTSPDYLDPLFDTTQGNILLGGIGALLAICYVVVKSMIEIDV